MKTSFLIVSVISVCLISGCRQNESDDIRGASIPNGVRLKASFCVQSDCNKDEKHQWLGMESQRCASSLQNV